MIGTGTGQYGKFTIPITAESVLQFNMTPGANQTLTRQYFVRLPDNYDSTKPYRVIYQGPGCSPSQDSQPTTLKAQPPLATDATSAGASARANAILVQLEQGTYNPAAYNGPACMLTSTAGCTATSAYCFDDWASEGGTPTVSSIPDGPSGTVAMEKAYFGALHQAIENNYCVDKTRQFYGGYSSGGWLAQQLGCWFPDVLRAQANVTGGIPPIIKANPSYCVGHPIAYFSIHNYPDPSNAFSGSVDGAFRVFTQNGCTGTFPRDTTPNGTMGPPQPNNAVIPAGLEVFQIAGVPNTNTFRCYHYTTCPPAYPMYFCVSNLSPVSAQHDAQGATASAAFWEFFSKF